MVLQTECIASLRQLSAQVSAAGAMLDGSDIIRELSQAVFCWHALRCTAVVTANPCTLE